MGDDRPKFVGLFRCEALVYGPPIERNGATTSCTFGGSGQWAVDDTGTLWELCVDYRSQKDWCPSPRTWVMVRAAIVRNPDEEEM